MISDKLIITADGIINAIYTPNLFKEVIKYKLIENVLIPFGESFQVIEYEDELYKRNVYFDGDKIFCESWIKVKKITKKVIEYV